MHLIKTYGIIMVLTLLALNALKPNTTASLSPIDPIHTESPRATLMGFLATVTKRYDIGLGPEGMMTKYMASDRLYPTDEEEAGLHTMYATRNIPPKYMDLSAIPDASKIQTVWRLSCQLKEILDRLPMPLEKEIPDEATANREHINDWRIPGTSLVISRITTGPNAGKFLFNAETVANIPKYYAAVKDMPYLEGGTPELYNYTFHKPTGIAMFLRHLVPVRWFMSLPDWTQILIADQPIWRWCAIVITLASFAAAFQLSRYMAHRKSRENRRDRDFWDLLPAIVIVALTPAYTYLFSEVLRISGVVYNGFNVFFWGVFFLTLTWLVWKSGQLIAEAIIISNEINAVSIDSQIIRLGFRLVSLILSLALMTEGANRLGLPAYSILTGLGIGGLAVALAAQHTLANLLGSLIIMFEKPFRVGHWIKAGKVEGIVEDVGFRSTLIRTLQNSLVSVPSSDLVNQSIENMTTRKFRLARRQVFLSLKTPISKVEGLIEQLRAIIREGWDDERTPPEVLLKSISAKGYEIMFDFRVRAPNEAVEFKEQQRILLAMAQWAEHEDIHFRCITTGANHTMPVPLKRSPSRKGNQNPRKGPQNPNNRK